MAKAPGDPLSCTACATSKRKCGKQQPSCQRCHARGIACRYPQAKPGNFVPLSDNNTPSSQQPTQSSPDTMPIPCSSRLEADIPGSRFDLSTSLSFARVPDTRTSTWWFASPETWAIDHAPGGPNRKPPSAEELDHALGSVHHWLAQWVDGQSSAFIHHELYRQRFPRSIQDAFMAWSCYLVRKPSNEQSILKIIEDKAQELVDQEKVWLDAAELDPLEHLARSQALLVYQLAGLYNGNIRLRYIAEKHIPVLRDWMHKAISSAQRHDFLGRFLVSPPSAEIDVGNIPWQKATWQSWILVESLRRTWLVVSIVQGVYLASQDGVGKCLGGMMFTARRGFWDAPSAAAWQQRCSEIYGGLVRLTETEKLFSMIRPEELDEFAKTVLKVTFGNEKLEGWGMSDSASPL